MSYWQNTLGNRVSRRRAMIATGAGALGAAFLAACGGGSDSKSSGESKDASGLVTAVKDETKDLKRGGTMWYRTTSEPVTMDPHVFPGNFASTHTHSGPSGLSNSLFYAITAPEMATTAVTSPST